MTESIFRTATKQAIKEIVEESGVPGRFGLILTEDSMENLTERIVDLFTMTIELRTRALQASSVLAQSVQTKTETFSTPQVEKSELLQHSNYRLPRKRYELSIEEKERMGFRK